MLRSRLLRAGDYDGLEALADLEAGLRVRARAVAMQPQADGARLEVEAGLRGLHFDRDGDRLGIRAERADATAGLYKSVVQLLLKNPITHEEYRVPAEIELRLVDEPDGTVQVVQAVTGTIESASVAGGPPLPAGLWEVHVVVIVAGFRATGIVRREDGPENLILSVGPGGRISENRPGLRRKLRRRMPPRLVRAIRHAQRAVRRVRR